MHAAACRLQLCITIDSVFPIRYWGKCRCEPFLGSRLPWPRSPSPCARVGLVRVPLPWRPPTQHPRLPSSRSSTVAACRACYDSACQLTVQLFEGLDRGANKSIVYHPQRAVAERPTRMFQDAQTTANWQFGVRLFFCRRSRPFGRSRALDLVAVRESAKRLSSGRSLRRRQNHRVTAKPLRDGS